MTGVHHSSETPSADEALISPGSEVDQFRVTRLIGRGAMGQVYLARDAQLGRRVALKVVGPRYLDSERARERFLEEARTTARFNHPHIVTLYSVGQIGDRPFLAMEYLEGQTLRQRIAEDRSGLDPMRVGLALTRALAEAHEHEVIHRDLKPDNVIIPGDGRLRVLDFGLAQPTSDEDDDDSGCRPKRRLEGTPAYMAPEQWRAGEVIPASDLWALGAILYEIATGRRPLQDHEETIQTLALRACDDAPVPDHPELSRLAEERRALILDCLAKDPAARPTAREVAERIEAILDRKPSLPDDETNPFPGLLPFQESQAPLFFGRNHELDAFIERLRTDSILPVVGPSGAGKSSFVRAGVIPRLRESDRWVVIALRPGRRPFAAAASALVKLQGVLSTAPGETLDVDVSWLDDGPGPLDEGEPRGDAAPFDRLSRISDLPADAALLAQKLEEQPGRLGRQLRRLAESLETKMLIFVDQLEELFTLCRDADEIAAFLSVLTSSADDPLDPVRLVFTLREDFLGRLYELLPAPEALGRLTIMTSPGPEALEQTLTRPLAAMGYDCDPSDLPRRMVEAVQGEDASLPLLGFAARELWERRDRQRRRLTLEQYEAIGGVSGALAAHADGVLASLTPSQLAAVRSILLGLVTPEETRRVVPLADLPRGSSPEGREVLARLIEARLVVIRRSLSPEGETAELELVHESLIHVWIRLARWIADSHEELAFVDRLTRAAELWDKGGRQPEVLWQGRPLHDALDAAERIEELPVTAQAFVDAARQRDRRAARRRLAIVATILTLSAVVALGSLLGAWALAGKEREAQRQRQRAELQSAEALLEGARSAFLRDDMVRSRAMLRASLERALSPRGRALWWQLEREPLRWQRRLRGDVDALAFSPDSASLAAVCHSPSISLIPADGSTPRTLRGHRVAPHAVRFSSDGRWLLSTGRDDQLLAWDLHADGATPATRLADVGTALALTPDDALAAVGRQDGRVRLLTLDLPAARLGGDLAPEEERAAAVNVLDISADGRLLAAGHADGRVRLWDLSRRELIREIQAHDDPLYSVAFHPSGLLATSAADSSVKIWRLGPEPQVQAEVEELLRFPAGIRQIRFGRGGAIMAAASVSGTVFLRDLEAGRELGRLDHDGERVFALDFDPEGRRLVTGTSDALVRLWEVDRALTSPRDRGHSGAVLGLAFSPDGQRLASASSDQSLRIWQVDTGQEIAALEPDPPARVTAAAFLDEGTRLVSAGADGSITEWNLAAHGRQRRHPGPLRAYLISLDARGDLNAVATGCFGGDLWLWDLASGDRRRELPLHRETVIDVAFSPDGRWLASAGHDRALRITDVESGTVQRSLEELPGPLHGLAFGPDGSEVAFTVGREPPRLWDIDSDEVIDVGPGGANTYWLDVHPDGRRLGLPRADGTAVIVDRDTGEAITLEGHTNEVNYLRFSPSGELAATSSDDGTVRLWEVETGRPKWWAPALLADSPQLLTHRGWLYLPRLEPGPAPRTHWRQAIESAARFALASPEGGTGCLVDFDGSLQIWDLEADREVRSEPAVRPTQVVALVGACLTLTAAGIVRLHRETESQELCQDGTAIGADGPETALVAAGREVRFVDPSSGEFLPRRSVEVEAGARALLPLEDRLILGYGDGSLQSHGDESGREPTFEGLPPAAVLSLCAGPAGTLAAGFEDGSLGLWSLRDGSRLLSLRLHGPLRHLGRVEGDLVAATELGDAQVIDLSLLELDRCALLRQVWDRVPLVWSQGSLRLEAPPEDHECAAD